VIVSAITKVLRGLKIRLLSVTLLGNAVYCSREPEFYIAWSPLCPTALFTGTAIDVSIPIPI